jgi:flagellar hook-associated protein 3 FlgL
MLNNQMQTNLRNNLKRIETSQERLASGRKINRPSDDPVGLSYSMRYRSDLTANDQYQRNLDSATSSIDYQETTIRQSVEVIQRARELAVQGSNGTNPDEALKSIAAEIDELTKQMHEIANSQFNGKYIFNGQRTDQPPYPDGTSYTANSFDTGKISFEVSRGVVMDGTLHAGEVFGQPGTAADNNVFAAFNLLSTSLKAADQNGVTDSLSSIDKRLDQMLQNLADLGAKSNRLNLIDNRLKETNINIQSLLSKNEDADMAEVITNLKTQENVFQASLSAGARIIRPSLVDFLR